MRPSDELRRRGIPPARLDPSNRQQLQDQIFTRYLQTLDLNCDRGDQLTRELDHFLTCVRTGTTPRVTGEDGRDAIALATRVLASMHRHQWENRSDGPTGPDELPRPMGDLLGGDRENAAA